MNSNRAKRGCQQKLRRVPQLRRKPQFFVLKRYRIGEAGHDFFDTFTVEE